MATMIDNLLTARNVSTTPVPAAAGSGAVGAPPAAPLTPAGPAPAPAIPADSAVAKAIGMGTAINSAANAQMATDPLMTGAMASIAEQQRLNQQAGAEMDARTAKIAALQAEPDPARIPIPRMKPLPALPTLEDVAKERGVKPEDFNNPMRVFGQMMPLLVAFGALATQRPGINALNAATAAMTAVKAGDKEAYDKAHKEWLENTKIATDTNNQMLNEYNLAINDRTTTMAEKQAKIAQIAAQHNDPLAKAALQNGLTEQFVKLLQMRQGITDPLIKMTGLVVEDERHKREMEFRAALEWAKVEADRDPTYISTDKVVGTILRKMATDPASVTDGDKAALAEAYKQRKASQPMFGGLVGAGEDGEPGADAPGATVPAPAAGGAKPAAPATTPPPVSMLKEGVVLTLNPPGGGAQQRWTLRAGKPVFLGNVPAS